MKGMVSVLFTCVLLCCVYHVNSVYQGESLGVTLTKIFDKLDTKISQTTSVNRGNEETITTLLGHYMDLVRDYADIMKSVEQIKYENKELKEDMAETKETLQKLQSEFDEIKEENLSYKEQITNVENRISTLNETMEADANERSLYMNQTLSEIKEEIAENQITLVNSVNSTTSMEQTVSYMDDVVMSRLNETILSFVEEMVASHMNESIAGKNTSLSTDCPDEFVKLYNSCYYFSTDTKSQPDAIKKCVSLSANLLSISSEHENCLLKNHLRHMNTGKYYWTSLIKHNSAWKWGAGGALAGMTTNFTDWHNGHPSRSSNYVCMMTDYAQYNWYSYPCSNTQNYICKI